MCFENLMKIVNFKLKIKSVLFLLSAFLVAGIGIFIYSYFSKPAMAAWFNENWLYRKAITLTITSSANDITDLETLVTVDTSATGKFQSSCQDLRFTNQGGKLLPYYIDSGCGTASTKVWVMADLVPKNTTTYTMYMYYGNPTAPAASDSNKFRLFNGLVGYWALNEASWNGTAGEVKDNSISGGNGTASCYYTGCTVPTGGAAGKYSNAASLTGGAAGNGSTTSQYVSVSPTSAADITTSSMTVSAWIKTSVKDDYRYIVNKYSTKGYRFFETTPSGHIVFQITDGTNSPYVESTTDASSNAWIHVMGVRSTSDNKLYIYVNGVQEGSATDTTAGATLTESSGVRIGMDNESMGNRGWSGSIDDVRVYNRALSTSEISQLYSSPGNLASYASTISKPTTSAGTEEQGPGPVGYWKFDDGQGTNAQDSSSSNNDGTLSGATLPTWQPEDRCVAGKCLYFDGSSSYISNANESNFDFANTTFTASGWFRTGQTSGGYLMAKGAGWLINVNNTTANKLGVQIKNGSGQNVQRASSSDVNDNKWHYYSVTITTDTAVAANQNITIYIDGKLDQGSLLTPSYVYSANNDPLEFGDRLVSAAHQDYFGGFIDEPKIYPYARSAAQIKTDYLAGKANASAHSGAGAVLGASTQDYLSNGLVGYWKMDEASWSGSSADVLDASGNSNNGTAGCAGVGCTKPAGAATGKFGNGGSFDGTQYVDAGTGSSLDITGNITVSAWINLSASVDANSYDRIISKGEDSSEASGAYAMWINGNKVEFAIYQSGTKAYSKYTSTSLSTGTWYHLVGVYDGSMMKIYLNGVLENSDAASGAIDSSANNLYLGARYGSPTANRDFNGKLDEVRIYNRALSPTEVSNLYNWAPGPVGYWKMDDHVKGASQTIVDISGNGNNGTTYNHTDCSQAQGKYGGACSFDGTDDYVSVADANSLDTGMLTVSFWMNPKAFSGNEQDLITKWGTSWGIWKANTASNLVMYFKSGGNSGGNSVVTNNLSNNTWTYITFTYDGSVLRSYQNGVQINSTTLNKSMDLGANPILIGAYTNGAYPYNGLLDDIKIYNYARTSKQIVSDMNGSHPNVGSPVGSPLGYWKFDEGQGTTAHNSGNGGSALNGTLTNMTSPATATSGWTQAGKYGKGLIFDGTDDYVSTSNESTFDGLTGFTISAWTKLDSYCSVATCWRTIISKRSAWSTTGIPFELQYQRSTDSYAIRGIVKGNDTVVYSTQSPAQLPAGVWHHLVLTWDGATLKLYLDGALNNSTAATVSITDNNTDVTIGYNIANEYFAGTMDEVKMYNYALTADEVKLEYNHGSSLQMGALGSNSSYDKNSANQEYCVPGDSTSCAPPVARLDFEEGKDDTCSGGTNDVCDTSGSGNDGAWNGTGSHWTSGKVGKAGKFNGTDDYVDLGDPASGDLDMGTGDFTVQAWVKTGTVSEEKAIIRKGAGYGGDIGWRLTIKSDGTLNPTIEDSLGFTTFTSTSRIDNNKWHFVVAAFDRDGNGTIYIDGKQDGTPTSIASRSGNIDNSLSALLGGNGNGNWLNGSIDQMRIYKYLRTPAQIAYDYNRGGPVGWWKFDECQGDTLHDSSGNNNSGTHSGSTTMGTCSDGTNTTAWSKGATGKRNSSLYFNGTDDYVNIGSGTSLDQTSQVSVSAWVYPTNNTGWYVIFQRGDGTPNGYRLKISNTSKWAFNPDASGSWTYSTDDAAINTWSYVVGTWDGTTTKLYVNGVLVSTTSDSGTPTSTAGEVANIGSYGNGAGQLFPGQIDDVRIYNYALTASQVKNVYNNGAINFAPATGAP